jgi:chromosome segregation ATPase
MLEENYLKPSNLPTKSDIDEVNKELYFLKKQLKELSGKINELSENK